MSITTIYSSDEETLLKQKIKDSLTNDDYSKIIEVLELLDSLETKFEYEIVERDHTECLQETPFILK